MAMRTSHLDDDFFGTPLSSAMSAPFNLEIGDILLGRISLIDNEYVYVSTGFKSEGRIPRSEFETDPNKALEFKVDDELEVMVDRVIGEDIFLSYKNVLIQRRWTEFQKKQVDAEPIEATVLKAVKGGYRMDVGLDREAFLPGSHLGLTVQTPEELVGKTLKCVIIEINAETANIVLSHRDYLRREVADREEAALGEIQVNDIRDGKITRLTNFGAFVDIGGIEGLVHISEIAWTRVGHPSEVLSCGADVRVKVLDCDPEKKRLSLSVKQASEDPWSEIETKLTPGAVIDGVVSRIAKFGAFVRVLKDFEGLMHVSEMGAKGQDLLKKLTVAEPIQVKVISVNSAARKIALGLIVDEDTANEEEIEKYLDDGKPHGKLGDVLRDSKDDKAK